MQISGEVVKGLIRSLSHKNPEIVEAAINSIGLIGLPEAFDSIEEITKVLWHHDSRCRSMGCWALSKICE